MAEKLGEAILELRTDDKKYNKGMDRAKKRAGGLLSTFGGLKTAAVAIGAGLAVIGKRAIDSADNFAKLSQQLGVSVERLSGLSHAAELAGTNMSAVERGLGLLARNATDAASGVGEARDTFEDLGIILKNNDGTLKDTDELLFEIADKFEQLPDGTEKTAAAMDLFGRSGKELIPLLNTGSDGLERMHDEATRLGIVLDTSTAKSAEEFNDALTRLQGALMGLVNAILRSGLLDILVKMIDGATNFATAIVDLGQKVGSYIKSNDQLSTGLKANSLALDVSKKKTNELTQTTKAATVAVAEKVQKVAALTTTTQTQTQAFSGLVERGLTPLIPKLDSSNASLGVMIPKVKDLTFALQELPPLLTGTAAGVGHLSAKWDEAAPKLDTTKEKVTGVDESMQSMTESTGVLTTAFGTLIADMSQGFADILFEGGSWAEKMGGIFKQLGKTLVSALITKGLDLVFKKLSGSTEGLGGLFGGLGSGGGAAGGGGGGGIGGLLGGLTGGGLIGGIGSAVGGIASLFKTNKQKDIEENTRFTWIIMRDFLNAFHEYNQVTIWKGLIPVNQEILATNKATLWDVKKNTWSTVEHLKALRGELVSGLGAIARASRESGGGSTIATTTGGGPAAALKTNRGGITTTTRRATRARSVRGG